MYLKNSIYEPYIPPRLKKFFNEHENIINKIFNILKNYKKNIIDSFYYSIENPPIHPNYKYTDKLYLGCILFIIKHGSTWESFLGPISGKQLNKRHHEYLKYNLYSEFYESILEEYLKNHDVKYLSIDSTIINNKNCTELVKHHPCNKNRKGIKISTIVDDIGSPLNTFIMESTNHDTKIAQNNINELINSKIINNTLKRTKGYPYLLGDSGYDSNDIREKLKKAGYKTIIKPNNKNNKYKRKKKIKKRNHKQYQKRIKVEHFFAIIKKYPKINCIYEKKIKSFNGLVLFLFGAILINRNNET